MAEEILSEPAGTESDLIYRIEGVNFKTHGVFVMESNGILDLPQLKESTNIDWSDEHGTTIDLKAKRYKNKEIELDCFIAASGKLDFFLKLRTFLQLFQKQGLLKLELIIASKPLIYYVYLADGVEVEKRWNNGSMIGTFTLKLTDPHPIKRMLRCTLDSASFRFSTPHTIKVFWGDGLISAVKPGYNTLTTHEYATGAATRYIILAGVIEEIEDYSSEKCEVVWNKY